MRPLRSIVLMLVTATMAGCASGEAFVDRGYTLRSVKKQKLPGYNGTLTVCYDSASLQNKRDQLAAEACEVYGLEAILLTEIRWQCRLMAPHQATYGCVDPKMRSANGGYINPFSSSQVEAWAREQKQTNRDAQSREEE